MARLVGMMFWGLICASLLAGLAGIAWLSLKFMMSPNQNADLFPLISVAALMAIFFPKARARFERAARGTSDAKSGKRA